MKIVSKSKPDFITYDDEYISAFLDSFEVDEIDIGKGFLGRYNIKYPLPIILKTLEHGVQSEKYSIGSWKKLNDGDYKDIYNAYLRHEHKGGDLDEESGLPHYFHALTNLFFLWYIRGNLRNRGE